MTNRSEKVETVAGFIFPGSQITVDGGCSYENKRHLLLGRKAMKNLDSILKSRDITLLTEVHILKGMGFPWWLSGKNPPAMQAWQEMQLQSLGWEDALEKEMTTHSSIPAWRIPWTEENGSP